VLRWPRISGWSSRRSSSSPPGGELDGVGLPATLVVIGVFGILLLLNVFSDYLSLLETRFVLDRMRSASVVGLVGWLVVDWAATTVVFSLAVPVLATPPSGWPVWLTG